MPNIRPSSDLRNSYNEISEFCHTYQEPVFITKNGVGDLAVMSIQTYERLTGKFELFSLIEEGLKEKKEGKVKDASQVLEKIRKNIRFCVCYMPEETGLKF